MYSLRQTLPDTPLDIVGDVHGEWQALESLLHYLGYRENGSHPQGRRLVFVGDLCDRGQNSPAILEWFKSAHDAGWAYMVLGNHELNLLVHDAKDGSGWYFAERRQKDQKYSPWHVQAEGGKAALEGWLSQQPLLLERADLRIVHAAWLPESMAQIEQAEGSLLERYRYFDKFLLKHIQSASWYDDYLREQEILADMLENPHASPPMMPASAEYDLARSRLNPIRALSCGVEKISDKPFFAGGRWRATERFAWWNDYVEPTPIVIGHYWRNWYPKKVAKNESAHLMPPQGNAWHGARKNVFCVDFSVGARWRDRQSGTPPHQSSFRLAALRFPEQVLMFDNGDMAATVR
ncbi:Bis(5'-nucleosyl)-tetraphosphatase prpE [asymmetrical] [Suttonella indologenes]|uniref:Bis(5'-nucleosyl)-tetraphosphatase prpE [asymmetrical] n=2 Tax=Suttonella indologenes TaxID=13276 RepID=A0A380MUP2_9GAMM|nr:metallophosphoesterase [Suttonella indologenes]SUO96008.1 Bis(5'-nucleosyl)-tetraphosphatase prpE [asymmetrical] [Suttonella indologenes]